MYADYYGFSGKPFHMAPDQRFFFDSAVHRRAMAYLRYGLDQGEGFIVVTGGVGTGKTTLVRHLFRELDRRSILAAQLVTTQVEPDDTLRLVSAALGLVYEGQTKAALLRNLEALARARFEEGKRILLIVDEAQNLPSRSIEELRMLSNFQLDGKSLFQSFLLGQEGFRTTLRQPGMEQVRQRIIASYHLEPLAPGEVGPYVQYRLGLVGWKGDPVFIGDVFAELYRMSRGVPRQINLICDRLLLLGCLEERHDIDDGLLATVGEEIEAELGLSPNGEAADLRPSGEGSAAAGSDISDGASRMVSDAGLEMLEGELQRLEKILRHQRKRLQEASPTRVERGLDDAHE